MKYGMRERVSGVIIVIALAVIFVPLLFSDPESPRDERPDPVLTIDQPVEVEHRDVPEPTPPEGLGQILQPEDVTSAGSAQDGNREDEERGQKSSDTAQSSDTQSSRTSEQDNAAQQDSPARDPIAELAKAAEQRSQSQASTSTNTGGSGWAVQVGSFGEAANAERLLGELRELGYPAFTRARGNNLTTVYAGPFGASGDAQRVVSELKAKINQQGLVVRVDS
ncbi:SPOR domain-containing protein [Halomonas binhaiensis]|uniref:SPOR domain-containing protein n=1 Tax=Halomonas binhaiensis TaxID=2562282 RepID=A0A5C1NII4_9GAMM|nr:SPOR domain-containing protein [Halomonas binhaiensis]QEM81559.1 SPOR domain-containing protein [Halomonas binhaiensis]